MTRCPCCKQPVETEKPIVDLGSNRLSFRGHELKLTPKEADIAAVLAEKMPETVEWDRMIAKTYGQNEPDYAEGSIRVRIRALRPRFKQIGLGITSSYGAGYRLEVLASSPSAS